MLLLDSLDPCFFVFFCPEVCFTFGSVFICLEVCFAFGFEAKCLSEFVELLDLSPSEGVV